VTFLLKLHSAVLQYSKCSNLIYWFVYQIIYISCILYMLLFSPFWACIIICCINRFTSLCKYLFNLLKFLAEALRCHVHNFQCLSVPVELVSSTWHQKSSAKNSSKLNKFLHSEVNLLLQHILYMFIYFGLFGLFQKYLNSIY
jgi:hypothetical protein